MLGNHEKVYDGIEFTSSDVNVTIGGAAYGEESTILSDVITNISFVGDTTNVSAVSTEIYSDYIDGNYEVTIESGTLRITPRELNINLGSYTKIYDGEVFDINDVRPQIVGAAECDFNDILDSISIEGNAMEVGIYDITSNYVSNNYIINTTNGLLTIV